MKRIIILSAFVVFIFSFLNCRSINAVTEWSSGWCGDNVKWSFTSDGVIRISGTGEMEHGVGLVTTIKRKPKKVIIDSGVTMITRNAFPYKSIKEVVIPDTVTYIATRAFEYCGIEKIEIPDSVTEIGEEAFNGCTNLKSVKLSNNLKTIHQYTFFCDENIRELIIPDSVKTIEKKAFSGMGGLTEITIGKGVEEIPENIFYNCSRLRKLINNSNQTINIKEAGLNFRKIIWYQNNIKTEDIAVGSIGIAEGPKYKLSYRLYGAKVKGTLKKSYRYGDMFELPKNVTKKGYIFSGWNVITPKKLKAGKNCVAMKGCIFDSFSVSEDGDQVAIPRFYKAKVLRRNKKSAYVSVDISKIMTEDLRPFLIRYSTDPDFNNYKIVCGEPGTSNKKKFVTNNLKKGKKYYFRILLIEDWILEGEDIDDDCPVAQYDTCLVYKHK